MIELREATGLTQEMLAALLKMPRSAYSMGESGERSFPAEGLQQLIALCKLVPPSANEEDLPSVLDVLANEAAEANDQLAFYKEGCRVKAANKQRELDKIIKRYEQGLRLLQLLQTYGEQLPKIEENAHVHNWIEGATSFAKLKLLDNGLAKQQLLALEIRQLLTV